MIVSGHKRRGWAPRYSAAADYAFRQHLGYGTDRGSRWRGRSPARLTVSGGAMRQIAAMAPDRDDVHGEAEFHAAAG